MDPIIIAAIMGLVGRAWDMYDAHQRGEQLSDDDFALLGIKRQAAVDEMNEADAESKLAGG